MRSIKDVIFIILFLLLSFLFYVWQRTQNIRLGYEISSLKNQCENLSQENVKLQLKLSSYLSMEKLDDVARKKGLKGANEKNVIYLPNK